MCSIGGIYSKVGSNVDFNRQLNHMLSIQRHRGPDAEGLWIADDDSVGFCHNRLAIVDLSDDGIQPMHSSDGRFTIVFNGEIYNYKALKSQLTALGSYFGTQSDTEVIIEAYRHWGEDMLMKLRGMFALAIYDRTHRTLFCARDRVGKKPFIYAESNSEFVFASEIPALMQFDNIDKSYDRDAIASLLLHNLRHIPDPYTAYKGIKRLRAGHAMIVHNGTIKKVWQYWQPRASDDVITPERLRELLEASIHLRMQADVPVGALLSGGIDSSAIVSIMQKYAKTPIHTYALGMDKNDDDLVRARLMAKKLGTQHKEFYFDADQQWNIFNRLIGNYGEPIMLLPLIHSYTLCKAINADGIKVVLNGNGADEIFYGYLGHIRTLKLSKFLDFITPLRILFKPFENTGIGWLSAVAGHRKGAYYKTVAQAELKRCLSNDYYHQFNNRAAEELNYWGAQCPSKHYIDESNFAGLMVENTHSVTTIGDLSAMAASIETRSPFLDQDILSFAFATDVSKKIPDSSNPNWLKAILRDAVRDLLPNSIINAPKRGFGFGIQERELLQGDWKAHLHELLGNIDTLDGVFCQKKVDLLLKGFERDNLNTQMISKLLAIQLWLQKSVA